MTQALSPLQNTAGCVTCMTVDYSHSHENSSHQSFVSTISTYIEEIALQDKLAPKVKQISKTNKKSVAVWTHKEVESLVTLLRRFGSDFATISTHMTKTRDQIKRKFKVLEKKWPHLADAIFEREAIPMTWVEQNVEKNDFLE